MANYTEVTEDVLSLAYQIISAHHPWLLEAKIGFIFQDEASTKLGKTVLGNATKISDKQRAAGLDLDYLITIAKDTWQELSIHQRKALIDHELCHCDFTQGYAKMRGHDVEEFYCIVQRYGLWKPDLDIFGSVVSEAIQEPLPGLEQVTIRRNGAILAVDPQLAPAMAE